MDEPRILLVKSNIFQFFLSPLHFPMFETWPPSSLWSLINKSHSDTAQISTKFDPQFLKNRYKIQNWEIYYLKNWAPFKINKINAYPLLNVVELSKHKVDIHEDNGETKYQVPCVVPYSSRSYFSKSISNVYLKQINWWLNHVICFH